MAPSSPKLQVLWREHINCTSEAQRAVDSKLRPPRNSAFGLFVQRMGSYQGQKRSDQPAQVLESLGIGTDELISTNHPRYWTSKCHSLIGPEREYHRQSQP